MSGGSQPKAYAVRETGQLGGTAKRRPAKLIERHGPGGVRRRRPVLEDEVPDRRRQRAYDPSGQGPRRHELDPER